MSLGIPLREHLCSTAPVFSWERALTRAFHFYGSSVSCAGYGRVYVAFSHRSSFTALSRHANSVRILDGVMFVLGPAQLVVLPHGVTAADFSLMAAIGFAVPWFDPLGKPRDQ